MLPEQASELTLTDSEPRRQGLDMRFVETPRLDQPKCAGYGVGAAAPEGELGRRFRPTAETRAKSSLLCRGRRGKEANILALGRGRRAKRPAINPGRRDGDEQTPIKSRVARRNGAVAGIVVHIHAPDDR